MDFDIVFKNQNIICIIIRGDPSFQPWALTFAHSPCECYSKDKFWEEVSDVGNSFDGPWLVTSDFNAISGQYESVVGYCLPLHLGMDFNQFKLNNGLVDVDSLGSRFTWCNGRKGTQKICERLDKGLANGEWAMLFVRAIIRNLTRHSSDHAPIILVTNGAMPTRPKRFRFEVVGLVMN